MEVQFYIKKSKPPSGYTVPAMACSLIYLIMETRWDDAVRTIESWDDALFRTVRSCIDCPKMVSLWSDVFLSTKKMFL